MDKLLVHLKAKRSDSEHRYDYWAVTVYDNDELESIGTTKQQALAFYNFYKGQFLAYAESARLLEIQINEINTL